MTISLKTWLQPKPSRIDSKALAVMVVAAVVYLTIFLSLLHRLGAQAVSFAYVFIAVIAWFYGMRRGWLAAIFCLVVTAFSLDSVIPMQMIVGTLLFFSVASVVGAVSSLYVKLRITESQLRAEHEKSEMILGNIFPRKIVERLKNGEVLIADRYLETTILFSDLVGFTDLTKTMKPQELVTLLNKVITGFDKLSERFHTEKIKTIGDAYLVVSGLPDENSNHAPDILRLALAMQTFIAEFNLAEKTTLQIRVGIHSGAVIGGVIGSKKFTFDLWGDTVNLASRLESTGIPGKIQVSQATYELGKDEFYFLAREPMEVKGHGLVQTYFLTGQKSA